MRKRDYQRLLDEQEATTREALDAARDAHEGFAKVAGQLSEAREVIDRLSKVPPEHSFVRIHMEEGRPSFEGLLLTRTPEYRLANASMLEAKERTISLDGTVEIPREHVVFVQLLGSLEAT